MNTKENLPIQNQIQIFPLEFINETTEYHFWKHSVRSQLIYSSVLFFLIGMVVALPLLTVDFSVRSMGIIRPISDVKMLTSPVSGRLVQFWAKENEIISKGTLLAKVESPLLEEQMAYNQHRREELVRYIQDLKLLRELDTLAAVDHQSSLKTPMLHQSFVTFQQELTRSLIELQDARQWYERNKYLHEREAISSVELEKSTFSFYRAQNQYRMVFEQQLKRWETELMKHQQELVKLEAEQQQLMEKRRHYDLYMPVTGTIQNIAGVAEGSYIHLNQQLAEISPDTDLVAECYVKPRDVGLLKDGMQVRLQIDAFDYNHWGTLNGKIRDISNDALMKEGQPYFRVWTELDRRYLKLPNGYRGDLKKGMTLRARFMVAELSPFQLLHRGVNDWLNPSRNDAG